MNFRFEASIKRIPRKTEGEWLFLSIRCFQTRTTFLLFFFFRSPSTFSSPSMFHLSRVRFTRARNSYSLFGLPNVRACTKHTTGSGGLTHRWPTIASNTSNFTDFTLHGSAFRTDTRGSSHGAYLSDNGQARILKDASTVTTSSMTPNVMYITPRCTSENM